MPKRVQRRRDEFPCGKQNRDQQANCRGAGILSYLVPTNEQVRCSACCCDDRNRRGESKPPYRHARFLLASWCEWSRPACGPRSDCAALTASCAASWVCSDAFVADAKPHQQFAVFQLGDKAIRRSVSTAWRSSSIASWASRFTQSAMPSSTRIRRLAGASSTALRSCATRLDAFARFKHPRIAKHALQHDADASAASTAGKD